MAGYTFNGPEHLLELLGIDVPEGAAAAEAAYQEVQRLVYTDPPGVSVDTPPEEVRERLLAIAEAGLVQAEARKVAQHFGSSATRRLFDVYVADGPRILAEARKLAKADLSKLAKLTTDLKPDDTAESVLERDDAAVKAWRNLAAIDDTVARLDATHSLAQHLARWLEVPDTLAPLWWVDVTDPWEFERVAELWKDTDTLARPWLALLRAGHTLELATPEEKRARTEAVLAARERIEEEQRQAHKPKQTVRGFTGYVQYDAPSWAKV